MALKFKTAEGVELPLCAPDASGLLREVKAAMVPDATYLPLDALVARGPVIVIEVGEPE